MNIRPFIFLITLCTFLSYSVAQNIKEDSPHLFIQPELQFLGGYQGEYVFLNSETTSQDEKLSYLEWQESPFVLCCAVSKEFEVNLDSLDREL